MANKYKDYFNISEEYYPVINNAVITEQPEIWKTYYPHETFVKLLKDTIFLLNNPLPQPPIWVEGAYGTGKSHAVLTLKKLLDASKEDVDAYFEKYPEELSRDLRNEFQQLKVNKEKIITVHIYGASNIKDDDALALVLQENIVKALEDNGIKYTGGEVLKDAAIEFLSSSWAKDAFNKLIMEKYTDEFGGDSVDNIIEKLRTYTGAALIQLMGKLGQVSRENKIGLFYLDIAKLINWIKDVIKENKLKAIIVIWDEFTDFFTKDRGLTGFQDIVEISNTAPFFLFIVTHKSSALFDDAVNNKKVSDRFRKPTCNIELPENMALKLMGKAMVRNEDSQYASEWTKKVDELYDLTVESRTLVENKAKISSDELKKVLPIHPYAALLLRYISHAFDSNQRSMFKFIKDDEDNEFKGFQWFIEEYGPDTLLTIDMLWDSFYEKGKEHLAYNIRNILDCYSTAAVQQLRDDEKRVLKTVLLLQAISQNVGDSVDIFIPTPENIHNAFEGTDLENSAVSIADALTQSSRNILYTKLLEGNKYQFAAIVGNPGDIAAIEKLKNETYLKKATVDLIAQGEDRAVSKVVELDAKLNGRYDIKNITLADFPNTIKGLQAKAEETVEKIVAVIAFAKDDTESAKISQNIKAALTDEKNKLIFIDTSINSLGIRNFDEYAQEMAKSEYNRGVDRELSKQNMNNANKILEKWGTRIKEGEFVISYRNNKTKKLEQEKVGNLEELNAILLKIDKRIFPYGLETDRNVNSVLWKTTSYAAGAKCGATEKLSGAFSSASPQLKLENYIGSDAWQQEKGSKPYWEANPSLLISKIKLKVIEIIESAFETEGRVAISDIYEELKKPPFGFFPCGLTAFVMGFVLKEYVNAEYYWSDGVKSVLLDTNKIQEMIEDLLKKAPTQNYGVPKCIVKLSDEIKAFNNASSEIFNIPRDQCTNLELTREHIRNKMKGLSFPIRSLKYVLDKTKFKTKKELVEQLIDLYSGIANEGNLQEEKKSSTIATEIGKLCIHNKELVADLKSIYTQDKCSEGMQTYIKTFEDGLLCQLSKDIGDNGQYMSVLQKKFDADAANWVWNEETTDKKIQEVILEYKIIKESKGIIQDTVSFNDAIKGWEQKCDNIKIAASAVKDYLDGSLGEFLSMLCSIKKRGNILDSDKQIFYNLLIDNKSEFQEFYSSKQVEKFKRACAYCIDPFGFKDEEIKQLYEKLPNDCFTYDKSEYLELVEKEAKKLNDNRDSEKLKNLWKDNTGTSSPFDWSRENGMPILCMIDGSQYPAAKDAFETVNNCEKGQMVNADAIKKAQKFLEGANFYDSLRNEATRKEAFINAPFIKKYAALLNDTDIEKLKNDLNKIAAPYDWLGHPAIDDKVEKKARDIYNKGGRKKAIEKIEKMAASDVKDYLKKLIEENMEIGIEIIRK